MRDAWSLRIPARCIWPRRWGRPWLACMAPPTRRATVHLFPERSSLSEARPEEISYKRRTAYSPAMLRISVEQVLDAVIAACRVSA